MKIISKLATCLFVASITLLQGCALEITRGSASAEINTGVFNAKAEVEFKKKEAEDTINSGGTINVLGKSTLASSSSMDLYLELFANNALIPDQHGAVQVSIIQDGTLISVATFDASVRNGVVLADNPATIEDWISSHDQLTHGTIAFDIKDIEYVASPGEPFEITNNLMLNQELLASATAFKIEPSYCGANLCISDPY